MSPHEFFAVLIAVALFGVGSAYLLFFLLMHALHFTHTFWVWFITTHRRLQRRGAWKFRIRRRGP